MTTFQVSESEELAAAFTLLANYLEAQHEPAARPVRELANAAQPGNGWPGPAAVSWSDRPAIAVACRVVASTHPEVASLLEGVAAGLDDSVRHRFVNG
jgi:hypothetical protein